MCVVTVKGKWGLGGGLEVTYRVNDFTQVVVTEEDGEYLILGGESTYLDVLRGTPGGVFEELGSL